MEYFDALEAYAIQGEIQPFAQMIAALEEEQLDIYLGMMDSSRTKGSKCAFGLFLYALERRNEY